MNAPRNLVGLFLLLLVATTAYAENDCGRLQRYATNFRGTVRSVEITGEKLLPYAVTLEVTGLKEDNLALKNGATTVFNVHSPTQTFADGDDDLVGRSYDLQAVWLACDGKLRRIEELVLAALRPVEPSTTAWLEVGHKYRWTVAGRTPVPLPTVPRHQMGGLAWTNAEEFLPDDDVERTVVFEVTAQDITQHEGYWVHILDGRVLSVYNPRAQ